MQPQIPYHKGVQWPLTLLGAWACALLNFGLIVPYYEAYKAGWRFIGLSFRFVAIDFTGALLSLASLATQNKWDKFGGATYIIVMILEIGLVVIQLSWIWRNRQTIWAAKAENITFDEFVAAKAKKPGSHNGGSDETHNQSSKQDVEVGAKHVVSGKMGTV
jgi:hypothetical protein